MHELQFILSQHQAQITTNHNKIQLATLLHQLIVEKNIVLSPKQELTPSTETQGLSQQHSSEWKWEVGSSTWMDEFPHLRCYNRSICLNQRHVLSSIYNHSYELNEWSAYNEILFNYQEQMQLVLCIPVVLMIGYETELPSKLQNPSILITEHGEFTSAK